jgi:hypothetical protein
VVDEQAIFWMGRIYNDSRRDATRTWLEQLSDFEL